MEQQENRPNMQSGLQLLLVALLLGGGYTFASYPGIFFMDSYARAGTAQALATRWPLRPVDGYLSILPSMLMGLCYVFTGNFACYTWLQAAFFLWSILLFCRTFFSGKARIVAVLLLMTCPLIVGYSVYWEPCVVSAGCLLCLLVLERWMPAHLQGAGRWRRLGYWLAYTALVFVMVGCRLNAGTAAVGLLAWQVIRRLRREPPQWPLKQQAAALLAGIVLAFACPRFVGLDTPGNGSVGFLWETACMLSEIGPGQGYDTYLDDLAGEGATLEYLMPVENGTDTMYRYELDWFGLAPNDTGHTVLKKYFRLALSRPDAFFKVKAQIIRNNLRELPFAAYDYDRNGQMAGYGFRDSTHRKFFYDVVTKFMEWAVLLRTPWLMFLLAILLAAAQRACSRGPCPAAKPVFIAFCFESAFFVTSQSFEYRYYFPTCLLLLFACLLSLAELVPALWRRLRRQAVA